MIALAAEMAELRAENERLIRLLSVVESCRMFDRFHAFKGIQDDLCPCCGGPIVIDESDLPRMRIKAVR
jgi:hypothetical protein